MDTRTTPPGRAWNYFKIMHVFKHPKFYEELRKKRKKFQKEQADKQASEQASDQASDEDASKQR